MLHELLQKIEELDKSATKGPWDAERGCNTQSGWFYGTVRDQNSGESLASDVTNQDAEFIALARTALPQLAKALRAVMELHQPLNVGGIDGDHIICEVCVTINGYGGWDQRDHPCETYQAITDAIGADRE